MIKIGEKLNSSIPRTLQAYNDCDRDYIIELIKMQSHAGADYMDINTSLCGDKEYDKLIEVIQMVLDNSDCGIVIDSTNETVIEQSVKAVQSRPLIINSITIDKRIDRVIPIAKDLNAGVIALAVSKTGIPQTAQGRVEAAGLLIDKLTAGGISESNIYIDILVEALATFDQSSATALKTIQGVKAQFPGVKTVSGVSNVSFGLPQRALLNTTFLTMAVYCGLDCAIMDVTSPTVMAALYASEALCGYDEFSMNYIKYTRKK